MTRWHVITGEYPPQPGGVSDYTRAVARGLAEAGDEVTVWAPRCDGADPDDPGVSVRRLPGHFGSAALRHLDAQLDREAGPHRLLVQYVPHAFGRKAMNLPFCWWLRSRRRDSIWVMFHEVAFPVDRRQPIAQNVVGVVTRRMAAIVGGAAERAFVSIPSWEPAVRELAGAAFPVEWLPVPSAIPVVNAPQAVDTLRARLAGSTPLVGHFGTYGANVRPLLDAALAQLLAAGACEVMLLGRGSEAAAKDFGHAHPVERERVHGAGELSPSALSFHLAACDVMLQPYPDGISSRRTSAMAALAHGRAVATTSGWLTEPLWQESGAVALAPAGDAAALAKSAAALLRDRELAIRMGESARRLYLDRFDVAHTIRALRREEHAARVA